MSDQVPLPNPYDPNRRQPDYGAPQAYGSPQPQPYATPAWQPPVPGLYAGTDADVRPGTVLAAAVLTFIGSGLTLLGLGFGALGVAAAPEEFAAEVEAGAEMDLASTDTLVLIMMLALAALAVWAVVAIVLGVLVLRRSMAARILLAISAVLTAVVSLIALPFGLLVTMTAVGAIVCLFVGGANGWFSRRGLIYQG